MVIKIPNIAIIKPIKAMVSPLSIDVFAVAVVIITVVSVIRI